MKFALLAPLRTPREQRTIFCLHVKVKPIQLQIQNRGQLCESDTSGGVLLGVAVSAEVLVVSVQLLRLEKRLQTLGEGLIALQDRKKNELD